MYIWSKWHPGNPGAVGVPCRDLGHKLKSKIHKEYKKKTPEF